MQLGQLPCQLSQTSRCFACASWGTACSSSRSRGRNLVSFIWKSGAAKSGSGGSVASVCLPCSWCYTRGDHQAGSWSSWSISCIGGRRRWCSRYCYCCSGSVFVNPTKSGDKDAFNAPFGASSAPRHIGKREKNRPMGRVCRFGHRCCIPRCGIWNVVGMWMSAATRFAGCWRYKEV